ncbi:hypothetical protein EFZ10_08385 [Tatumella sp. TA1]|nr:hypothetical protein EFZ10_08385 [Tatumella sp. TA1]
MTKQETKTRCRDLFLSWEGRHDKGPAQGLLFQAYMRKQPDFCYFTFGRASMHQTVQGWVDDWTIFYQ